jgi:hypothetical protein
MCCSLCSGPHSKVNHSTYVKVKPDARHCINCASSKHTKHNHTATDRKCPFWQHHFDCDWLKRQFKFKCN